MTKNNNTEFFNKINTKDNVIKTLIEICILSLDYELLTSDEIVQILSLVINLK